MRDPFAGAWSIGADSWGDRTHSRRRVIGFAGAGTAAVLLGTGAFTEERVWAAPKLGAHPFQVGVASGDPSPDGFVLWTRLAPKPLDETGSGGMPARNVTVWYEVATDERFTKVVKRGKVTATPDLNHSVHVEVAGLQSAREYFYRFKTGSEISQVGRAKTAPAVGANVNMLTFAFASCQAWHDGFFTPYQHMAKEDLDFVVHLGDYHYEYGVLKNKRGVTDLPAEFGTETTSLRRYRMQYGLYKSDPDLIAAHQAFTFIHTNDDHEIENNWASVYPGKPGESRELLMKRRAAGFQTMYENLPMRRAAMPNGPGIRLFRRLSFGNLMDLSMLDTRQYRDDQACGDKETTNCAGRLDPSRTILGAKQRDWLARGFSTSKGRWHVLGNQAPMTETDSDPSSEVKTLMMDPWDGYVADRNRVMDAIVWAKVRNPVVITGDRHQNYACDLLRDFDKPDSKVVATEFVGTSIASGSDGNDLDERGKTLLKANAHMKFLNSQRGYVRCTVTKNLWKTDFKVVPYITKKGAPIATRATYVVEDKRPGLLKY